MVGPKGCTASGGAPLRAWHFRTWKKGVGANLQVAASTRIAT